MSKLKNLLRGFLLGGLPRNYKNEKGSWLSPDQIQSKDGFVSRIDGSKVKIGPSEAMSKSKKNIVILKA